MLRFVLPAALLCVPVAASAAPPDGAGAGGEGEAPRRLPVQTFVLPIAGEPWKDWAITNYVDVDPKFRTFKDARGGPYTYDFHEAIDYTLPNFAAMDRGVDVLAAADGVVVETDDGHPDRNAGDPTGRRHTPANLVRVEHPGGLRTSYLHLRKGSVVVEPGDRVTAGQKLGQVGSSGRSSDPHLHFEVATPEGADPAQIAHRGGQIVDTLADPKRWWKEPLPYAGDVPGVLDHGVTAAELTEDLIRDRPADAGPFASRGPAGGADRTVFVWARLHGFAEGDKLLYEYLDPRGRVQGSAPFQTPEIRFGWWASRWELPARVDPGRWTVRVTRNGAPLFTEEFTVTSRRP